MDPLTTQPNMQPQPQSQLPEPANTNNIPAVEKEKNAVVEAKTVVTNSEVKVDEIQQRIRRNKLLFYGYPLLVIIYGISVVLFIIVPTFQKYFTVQEENSILDQNIANVKQSSSNLSNAITNSAKFDQYETELSNYIPTEARVGQLISIIQTQANDFGLERQEIATTDPNSSQNQTSVGNLAQTDSDSNALFQTISSGEIEFTPRTISTDAKARLLAIDVTVKGKRDNFLKFVEALKSVKPIINLVYVEYQETPSNDGQATVSAALRFESYALKLNPDNRVVTPTKYTVDDAILTTLLPVETFNISSEIQKAITLSSTTTVTPTPTVTN